MNGLRQSVHDPNSYWTQRPSTKHRSVKHCSLERHSQFPHQFAKLPLRRYLHKWRRHRDLVTGPPSNLLVESVSDLVCLSDQLTIEFGPNPPLARREALHLRYVSPHCRIEPWLQKSGRPRMVYPWRKFCSLVECHRQMGHLPSTMIKRSCGPDVHLESLAPSTEVLKKCRPWSLHSE